MARSPSEVAAAAYAPIGVGTFGHAASGATMAATQERAECRAINPKGYCGDLSDIQAPLGGMLAATLWPLYWSWKAWS